jgi:hypothetical protein
MKQRKRIETEIAEEGTGCSRKRVTPAFFVANSCRHTKPFSVAMTSELTNVCVNPPVQWTRSGTTLSVLSAESVVQDFLVVIDRTVLCPGADILEQVNKLVQKIQ